MRNLIIKTHQAGWLIWISNGEWFTMCRSMVQKRCSSDLDFNWISCMQDISVRNILYQCDYWKHPKNTYSALTQYKWCVNLKPRLHYTWRDATWRDAIWRDIQVLFTLCATSSRAVTWQQGIWDPEQIKLCNLNGCFDPTWHCVYLTDIPPKITSICITQPHKHITWNTNSSHWWVLIKVCWGVNPGCVNSTSHVTLNQAS